MLPRPATCAPLRAASFPPAIEANPYQRLLYESLSNAGVDLVAGNRLKLGWLRRARGHVDLLHFHWPQIYWRHERGPRMLRGTLSWLRVTVFAFRLLVARAMGFGIVWTVHQVRPHESPNRRLDEAGAKILARASLLLIAHDRATATAAAAISGKHTRVAVVPHGSYVGVYPPGRSRSDVRGELAIDDDACVFLALGNIRAYKDLGILLAAFERAEAPRAVLVIAGATADEATARELLRAAERDRRLRVIPEFVPDERLAELYEASDVAVLARGDGGTSGALILALSLGCPPLAASAQTYLELVGPDAGWFFTPGDSDSLTSAIEAISSDPAQARDRREAALRRAADWRWDDIGRKTASVFRESLS